MPFYLAPKFHAVNVAWTLRGTLPRALLEAPLLMNGRRRVLAPYYVCTVAFLYCCPDWFGGSHLVAMQSPPAPTGLLRIDQPTCTYHGQKTEFRDY